MAALHLMEQQGAWPFITRRVFRTSAGGAHVWSSRIFRKGLHLNVPHQAEDFFAATPHCRWSPRRWNCLIAAGFAVGALLFAIASGLSLAPAVAEYWALNTAEINVLFFAGSIPFTAAATMQFCQACNPTTLANEETASPVRRTWFAWRPHDVGWLSCFSQWVGTLLFNISTLNAMLPTLNWLQQDFGVWIPNFLGSILFLTSGYLAFIEACHAYWQWRPQSITWWVVLTNLLGCVGFMVAAVFAFVPSIPVSSDGAVLSAAFTLQGAVCFLVGAQLMLLEAYVPHTALCFDNA